jgi:hypothetical protein
VTWRYWLRKVRELDLRKGQVTGNKRVSSDSDPDGPEGSRDRDLAGAEKGGEESPSELPCRLSMTIKGAEWFVYNRSAAYDSIIAALIHGHDKNEESVNIQKQDETGQTKGLKKRFRPSDSEKTDASTDPDLPSESTSFKEKDTNAKPPEDIESLRHYLKSLRTKFSSNTTSNDDEDSLFLQFLPINIECTKAAVVMGNENTKSVLITKVDSAKGQVDASACRAPDRYRQLINFEFKHPVIQIKPNDDYKEDQTTSAIHIKQGSTGQSQPEATPAHNHSFFHRFRRRTYHRLQKLVPYFRSSVESFSTSNTDYAAVESPGGGLNSSRWQGLSRYLDESEQDDNSRWSSIEYATVSTIVDSPSATMSYFWDIPGTVPAYGGLYKEKSKTSNFDVNGSDAPEWGLDLTLRGAMINYGPWADRQRADLQKVFFPSLCKDAAPTKMLQPGQTRLATQFKLYLQLDDETTLRVPIREESKNWKWKTRVDTMGERLNPEKQRRGKHTRKKEGEKGAPGPEIRPFGWLDVKVAANATVTYCMDMFAGEFGFSNKLEIDIPNTEITTSVNHGLLWRSVDQRLSCDLSNPLEWNGLHNWKFDITSNGLELFILREHIFLLIDLVDDWASGPPPDYLTFAPFRYLLNLAFGDFRLYLNANDSNIINNPSDFEDNTFLIIFGTALVADLCIPLDKFRPHRNDISFDVKAHTGGLNLHVPPWNTQATFLSSTELARLKDLGISGTYQYCATTSTSNTDTLLLNVTGRSFQVQLFGFLIRYILRLKENYFGDDIRFKTLEEYQQVLYKKTDSESADLSDTPPHKKSNDLDVILSVRADEVSAFLPTNLYCAKKSVRLETANLSVDLRFTNYYMDMQLTLSPIGFLLDYEEDGAKSPKIATSGSQLFVDGIEVFGHRVFGLPPSEPTYVCNWDFNVGALTGECTADFLCQLAAGGRAFAFSFDDDENALPSISTPPLHDITFLRAVIEPIHIWVHVEESAFLVSTGAISANFNDWAGTHFSTKLRLEVPDIKLACVDAESASRHRSRMNHPVETHAYLHTAISLTMVDRKLRFAEDRQLQQLHVKREDLRTHRADFLLHSSTADEDLEELPTVDNPAMGFPPLPLPLETGLYLADDQSSVSIGSSIQYLKKRIQRKSSFLSFASSSQASGKSTRDPQGNRSIPTRQSGFGSDSRSRSRHASAHPQGSGLRDISASTGRQSSFYSAIGDNTDRRGLPPSSVAFSSSYIAPYFPLEAVEPDSSDLPDIIVTNEEKSALELENLSIDDVDPAKFSEQETHTSFIVELKNGIRLVCNPEATIAIARLLTSMQPVAPNDMIDSLHIDAVSEIFKLEKEKIITGRSTDVNVRIPSVQVRFMNDSPSVSLSNPRNEVDQYDLSLFGFAATARTGFAAKEPGPSTRKREATLLHLQIKSADISAKERFNGIDDPQAAINGGIEDLVFWMCSHDSLSANLNLKVIEVATRSSKVEYLASLLHRTSLLGTEIADTFSSLSEQQRNRMQLFTFLVAIEGQRTTDPLFLTRPSYVLRSAPNHLRINDTWKVVTRLRHMFNSLDRPTQNDIAMRCLNNTENVPQDAAQQVLAVFDQWRSWDLTNVTDCVAMRKLYGPTDEKETLVNPLSQPAKIGLAIGLVAFQLDPGPKQNELGVKRLNASLAVNPPAFGDIASSLSDSMSLQATATSMHTTVLQVCSSDVSVNLNWELCELVEGILKLYNQSKPSSPSNKVVGTPQQSQPGSRSTPEYYIHVVVATEKGSITLDTINIRAVSITQGLKGSFIISGDDGGGTSASIMIAAEAATSKLRSHFQELAIVQLRHPSVYVSYEGRKSNTAPENVWKSAANCQELSFVVRQDPLVLLEVADLLIGDEIAQIHRLSLQLPKKADTLAGLDAHAPHSSDATNKINVALFLDMYHISVPLLHSLTYNVSGVVARASIAARQDSEIVFDFDVKENSHDIQTQKDNKSRSISLLQMPPTNGRVTSRMGSTETTICIFASIEPVQFDAAAIHSLLTALNRPEISNVIKEARENVQGIQKHIEGVFGPKIQQQSRVSRKDPLPIIYDAHLTFAGLDIFADTSGGQAGHDAARLSFNIGCVQLEAANRLELHGPILSYPEIHIGLRHIMFDLSRVSETGLDSCGNFAFAAYLTASSKRTENGDEVRSYHVKSDALEINLFAETASTVVDVMGHLQDRIKDLDLSREVQYLQKIRKPKPRITVHDADSDTASTSGSTTLFASMYSLELLNIQVSWIVGVSPSDQFGKEKENLVLSSKRIDLSTRKENSARLTIEDLQLQMVPASEDKSQRSQNSALLPEVIFNVAYVSTHDARRLAFQAAGKSLNLRLTSQFMIPAADLQKSIQSAADKVSEATASWTKTPTSEGTKDVNKRKPFFGKKRMESLLVDADFAGAVVHLQGKRSADLPAAGTNARGGRAPQSGRYGQFSQDDPSSNTILRSPGLAWKVEFKDNGIDDPSLNAEVKVDASTNILYPTVVPLVMEISSSMKEIISDDSDDKEQTKSKVPQQSFNSTEEDNILTADPSAVLGRTRLNLGIRIRTQEFSLSCQPIARVAATASFDDIYMTINTVRSAEHGNFFAASAIFTRLQASVQHVYSRESTGSFDVDSIVISLMNSKHVSGTSGMSAILKISPMKVLINAKQLQDFLLFREIWVPPEIRQPTASQVPSNTLQSQTFSVQRYQQVAATGAFPWNATVSIAELDVQLDLGQAIGKSAFVISNFWISSKKNSDWEQNLCMGFDKVGVDSTGRMSGFVALQNFRVRTSITWPEREKALNQTPLIQGSLGFSQLRVKAAFDYQAFLVADITTFEFLMYNVRNGSNARGDRLVAILDGDSVQVFCTTTTASQALALYQAFQRLVQEKRTNYETSLHEIERFMKRKSSVISTALPSVRPKHSSEDEKLAKSPISLHTDVVVTLKAVNIGAFPSTFFDSQIFKLEALDAQARFAVTMDDGKIHSGLGLTLGQLRIGLAGVKRPAVPKTTGEISVEEVVESATGSRGGTILKVPKVEATMETWQSPDSTHIDYIFKSFFEGKVEVGWNYSRISYIRGMYANHSRALAQRLGKPLPPSAVKITGVPDEEDKDRKKGEQQKITAEVTVPQSKYEYTALEPPIIETPQLRDMGEATPPLEWIGLHRDRLPNLTHQIVIVTLLEVASEVEDAYARILGSS